MVKQIKTKNNKQKGTSYYDHIIEGIQDSINNLKKEEELYQDTPRILAGVRKNLKDRQKDLEYYEDLVSEYKEKDWIN